MKLDKLINYLKLQYADEKKLMCPRCGWLKGQAYHCGLCEADEKNIIKFYDQLLNEK